MYKLILTEREAIQFCIDYGVPKAEERLQTKTFQRLQRLDGKKMINALFKDVASLGIKMSHYLDENGEPFTGRNRKYIFEFEKIKFQKRESHYKGNQSTRLESEILKEYIMKRLIQLKATNQKSELANAASVWVSLVELYPTWKIDIKKIHELFDGLYSKSEVIKTKDSLLEKIESRNEAVFKLAIKHLEKEKRIQTTEKYFMKADRLVTEISKKEFDYIEMKTDIFVNQSGIISLETYKAARRRNTKLTEDQIKMIEMVNEMLEDEFNIQSIFKGIDIKILSENVSMNVNKNQMLETMLDWLVILIDRAERTKDRDKKSGSYEETNFVEREFSSYNMYLFLKEILGVSGLEDRIKNTKPTQEEIIKVQERYRAYGIAKAELEKELNKAF